MIESQSLPRIRQIDEESPGVLIAELENEPGVTWRLTAVHRRGRKWLLMERMGRCA